MNDQNYISCGPSITRIFLSFFRLGLTAFGGPAMVAHIGVMVVEKKHWLSRDTFKDGVATAQTIPGATAMQTAAYAGLRIRGVAGAAAAYIGFGLPATLLMIGLSAAYEATHELPVSHALFQGLQIIVVAIVARACFTFGRTTIKSWKDAVISLAAALYLMVHGNPFLVILFASGLGIIIYRQQGSMSGANTSESGTIDRFPTMQLLMIVVSVATALIILLFVKQVLFHLSFLMMQIDLMAFGGGFASIPLMLHKVVDVSKWMTAGSFMDGIAMGQITPGPIVITATFVGYQVAGIGGAIAATAGIFLPSFVLIVAAAHYFIRLKHNAFFQRAMNGILASFVGLLLATTIKFGLTAHWEPVTVFLCVGAFTALMLKTDILLVVSIGGVLSSLLLRH
jgi:chromate transporter